MWSAFSVFDYSIHVLANKVKLLLLVFGINFDYEKLRDLNLGIVYIRFYINLFWYRYSFDSVFEFSQLTFCRV